jgi:nitrogen fixation protein NifU and related proteins
MYNDKVMDHFMHPRNMGIINKPDGVGTVGNPICGDVMKMYIKVKIRGTNKYIEDIKFQTLGCGAAIATSSMISELIKGKSLEEALTISNKTVAEALGGLPVSKLHCSNLAADAVQSAIKDYEKKLKTK